MRPVVVAVFELVPGAFELFLPGLVLKQLPQWRGSGLYAIVQIRLPEPGHPQQLIAEVFEFLLKIR